VNSSAETVQPLKEQDEMVEMTSVHVRATPQPVHQARQSEGPKATNTPTNMQATDPRLVHCRGIPWVFLRQPVPVPVETRTHPTGTGF
jgi:hypothetical protein